jgi:hypothetical protein
MILTQVRFAGATTASLEEATAIFAESASRYLDVPGLIAKVYLRAQDGSVGAVYWWTDRPSAENRFNDRWREGVEDKYGVPPTVEYFEAPIVVDCIFGTIRTEPPHRFEGQGHG